MSKRIAVLMGGWSAEREVSLNSGASVVRALMNAGYQVTAIDVQRDIAQLLTRLFPRPDAVFNALHGRFGEDGCLQGILNILDIPYTHSGLLASALAMDKPSAKKVFSQAGIPVALSVMATREHLIAGDPIERPYVIKPANEGSSVGVRIVMPGDNVNLFAETSWPYGDSVMVERYVPGRELTVAVMGDRALGCLEIRPKQGFYDYANKYTDGKAEHIVPAPVPKAIYDEACRLAVLAHQSLGCRGVSRADLRYDDTRGDPGELFMLEVNTQPGMTNLSLVPEIAAAAGISFPDLVDWMVKEAACDA
ncbi:MAG: D-alanine--D-alanine ligase [Alphaproteobacteria bacterium]|nr:D-alanine--D-alanine ligase [Alphaproteobacteria bacterium]